MTREEANRIADAILEGRVSREGALRKDRGSVGEGGRVSREGALRKDAGSARIGT
jgi:hypothetical protein